MTIERVGSDGVIHQFPDGTSEAVIQKVTGTSHVVPRTAAPKTEPFLPNALGAGLQGLTMGFSDEAIAKIRSMMDSRPHDRNLSSLVTGQPVPGSYEDYLQAERQGTHKYNAEHPYISAASELAGGLIPTIGATIATGGAAGPGMAAINATRGAKVLNALKPALFGGAQGAVSGAGTSESKTAGGTASDALTGGVTGAAFGQGLAMLGKGAKASWDSMKLRLGMNDPNNAANLAIAKAIVADGHSPQSVPAVIDALGRGELTLADLGENTRALLKKSTQAPGQNRNDAIQYLSDRAGDKVPRVSDDLQKLMSGSPDFYTDIEKMKAARALRAEPLYKSAYANAKPMTPQTTQHLGELSKSPSFQDAMKVGMKRAADEGLDLSDPKNVLKGLQLTKESLDDMIKAAQKGGQDNQARVLMGMKKKLLEDMDNASSDYKLARQAYAGDSEIMSAAENGANIYGMSEPDMRKLLLTHVNNPSELDAMRAGIAQAMLEKLRSSPDARPIKSVLGGDMERKLRLAFHDDNAFDQFVKQLQNEERMMLTQKQGLKAVPADLDAQKAGDIVGAVKNAASGNFGSAFSNAVDTVMPSMAGMPANVAAPTTQKLLTPIGKQGTGLDPVIESIMGSLKDEEANIKKFGLGGYLGTVAGGIGSGAARTPPTISGGAAQQEPEGGQGQQSLEQQQPPQPPQGALQQANAPTPETQPQ